MKKRLFALFLALCVVVSLLPAVSAAPADAKGHWGEDHIERWADHGIVDVNELFRPDDAMTRGEVAKALSLLLGLKESADIGGYPDMDRADPNFLYISLCVAAGILGGRTDGTMDPNGPVSRQELFTMLGRALHIRPEPTSETVFLDGEQVADYAAGYINALVNMGAVGGVSTEENILAPESDINRASVMAVLDKAIDTYVDTDGVTVEAGEGITLINADRVTVTGEADTVVVAGNNNEVTLTGTAGTANVVGQQSELVVAGQAETVAIGPMAGGSAVQVTETGAVDTVKTEAADSKVTVSGTVANVEIAETAAKTEVAVTENATVENLDTKAENVTVSGEGTVENATVSGDNTAIDTPDTKVEVSEGTTGTTAGGESVGEQPEEEETKPSTPSTPSTPDHDDDYYYHYCDWDNGTVTKEPTCVDKGVMTYTCYCGDTYTEEIPATGVHTYEWIVDQEATTTATGLKHQECSVCHDKIDENTVIPVQPHDHSMTKTAAVDATCTTDGTKEYWTCSDPACAGVKYGDASGGVVYTAEDLVVAKLGHDEVSHEAKAPTCTEKGWDAYVTCSRCDYTTYAEKAALDHNYEDNVCTRCDVIDPNVNAVAAVLNGTDVTGAYTTVAAAIEGASSGNTVKLLDNATENLTVNKELTLNLNGKTLTADVSDTTVTFVSAITAASGADLTITGNGTVNGGSGLGGNYAVIAKDSGVVTIENGTYTVGADKDGADNTVIYARDSGEIYIEDGYFYTDTAWNGIYYVLNQKNGTAGIIVVTGGRFKNFDPAGGDDVNQPTNFVALGYKSVGNEDGTYSVEPLFAGGTGTESDPYQIETKEQLYAIEDFRKEMLAGNEYHFIQTADIAGVSRVAAVYLRGSYNGGGYDLRAITGNYTGVIRLFNFLLGDTTIKNVNTYSTSSVGFAITYDICSGVNITIDNCHSYVDANDKTLRLENVGNFGFIVTYSIDDCKGSVNDYNFALESEQSSKQTVTISNCTVNGNVQNTGNCTAAFIGQGVFPKAGNGTKLIMRNCTNNGNVTSKLSAGLITGNGTYAEDANEMITEDMTEEAQKIEAFSEYYEIENIVNNGTIKSTDNEADIIAKRNNDSYWINTYLRTIVTNNGVIGTMANALANKTLHLYSDGTKYYVDDSEYAYKVAFSVSSIQVTGGVANSRDVLIWTDVYDNQENTKLVKTGNKIHAYDSATAVSSGVLTQDEVNALTYSYYCESIPVAIVEKEENTYIIFNKEGRNVKVDSSVTVFLYGYTSKSDVTFVGNKVITQS